MVEGVWDWWVLIDEKRERGANGGGVGDCVYVNMYVPLIVGGKRK